VYRGIIIYSEYSSLRQLFHFYDKIAVGMTDYTFLRHLGFIFLFTKKEFL